MRRGILGLAAAGLAGVLLGALLTLGLPSTGRQGREPSPPPPSDPSRSRAPGSSSTLLAWTPGGLPSGFAAEARSLETVEAVAEVRSGTAWLSSWGDGDGSVRRPPPGLRIPIEVAAVSPSSFRRFVPSDQREAFESLTRRGRTLLGRSGAGIRGISAGGRLTFGDATMRVDGVVEDELIGAHEVVVSRRAGSAIGISRPRYLLIEPREGVARATVERGLRRLLPRGVRLRVRGSGETPLFRQGDSVLPPVRLKEIFGEFAAAPAPDANLRLDARWVARNIRTADIPILGQVRCHRRILPALREGVRELIRRGLGDLVDPTDFGGCFAPRALNRDPGAGISHHTWGIAFDINVSTNLRGQKPQLSPEVVEVFEELGFTWGGRWLVPDGMHFEFLRLPPE